MATGGRSSPTAEDCRCGASIARVAAKRGPGTATAAGRRTYTDESTGTSAYDTAGRLVRQSSSGGAVLSIEYDGESERPAAVDLAGAVTRFEYDAQGRATRHVSPAGRATRFAYDAQGRRVVVTDAAGRRAVRVRCGGQRGLANGSRWQRCRVGVRPRRPPRSRARSTRRRVELPIYAAGWAVVGHRTRGNASRLRLRRRRPARGGARPWPVGALPVRRRRPHRRCR